MPGKGGRVFLRGWGGQGGLGDLPDAPIGIGRSGRTPSDGPAMGLAPDARKCHPFSLYRLQCPLRLGYIRNAHARKPTKIRPVAMRTDKEGFPCVLRTPRTAHCSLQAQGSPQRELASLQAVLRVMAAGPDRTPTCAILIARPASEMQSELAHAQFRLRAMARPCVCICLCSPGSRCGESQHEVLAASSLVVAGLPLQIGIIDRRAKVWYNGHVDGGDIKNRKDTRSQERTGQ